MTTTYQVSTPTYTAVITVNATGIIVHTPPALQQAWLRRRWKSFHWAQIQRYGVAYRAVRCAPQEATP